MEPLYHETNSLLSEKQATYQLALFRRNKMPETHFKRRKVYLVAEVSSP